MSAPERSTKWLTILKAGAIFNHVVKQSSSELDSIFHALADATRRDMLRALAKGEHSVGQLAEPFEISLAAVSKHIKVLEKAGLVQRTVKGRTHHCRLAPAALATAHEWLSSYEQFWNSRLDTLEALLRSEHEQSKIKEE